MHKRQRRWIAPAGILVLLLGFVGLADSGEVTLKCLPDDLSLSGSKAEDRPVANGYSVPRKMVLIEITTATW
ncbi:MAG: hypothetical protein WBD64_05255 [Candidatus Zixiibacteriota bacterium]